MSANTLAGRHIIVTGAGRNVGAEVCHELVRRGAQVAAVDLDLEAATETAVSVNKLRTGAAVAIQCDVSNSTSVNEMVAEARSANSSVDGLVNSVAVTDRGRTILSLMDDEWASVLGVTLTSVFYCSRAVAQTMTAEGVGGSIVNVGSTSGYQPRGNALAYPVAKSASLALTKSMARQLGEHGIRVNSVTPNKVGSPVGRAETNDRPVTNLLGRACEPTDIAKAIAFALSDEAGFITGTDIVVDGGALVSMNID